jgi:hypothetical protein
VYTSPINWFPKGIKEQGELSSCVIRIARDGFSHSQKCLLATSDVLGESAKGIQMGMRKAYLLLPQNKKDCLEITSKQPSDNNMKIV